WNHSSVKWSGRRQRQRRQLDRLWASRTGIHRGPKVSKQPLECFMIQKGLNIKSASCPIINLTGTIPKREVRMFANLVHSGRAFAAGSFAVLLFVVFAPSLAAQ